MDNSNSRRGHRDEDALAVMIFLLSSLQETDWKQECKTHNLADLLLMAMSLEHALVCDKHGIPKSAKEKIPGVMRVLADEVLDRMLHPNPIDMMEMGNPILDSGPQDPSMN